METLLFPKGTIQRIKNRQRMQELLQYTYVSDKGPESRICTDLLQVKKGRAVHASSLAWRIPGDREAWRATACEVHKVWHDWVTSTHTTKNKTLQ